MSSEESGDEDNPWRKQCEKKDTSSSFRYAFLVCGADSTILYLFNFAQSLFIMSQLEHFPAWNYTIIMYEIWLEAYVWNLIGVLTVEICMKFESQKPTKPLVRNLNETWPNRWHISSAWNILLYTIPPCICTILISELKQFDSHWRLSFIASSVRTNFLFYVWVSLALKR